MKRFTFTVATDGNTDIVNLSPELAKYISGIKGHALLHVFVGGSTAAITTIEFEPGLVKHDMPEFFQRLVPDDLHYDHEATWNDDNGHSHVRAALVGPGLTIPFWSKAARILVRSVCATAPGLAASSVPCWLRPAASRA